jgi:hypothetical protein
VIYKKSHPELDELTAAKVRYVARVLGKHPVDVIEEAIDRIYRECNDHPPEATLITEEILSRERLL